MASICSNLPPLRFLDTLEMFQSTLLSWEIVYISSDELLGLFLLRSFFFGTWELKGFVVAKMLFIFNFTKKVQGWKTRFKHVKIAIRVGKSILCIIFKRKLRNRVEKCSHSLIKKLLNKKKLFSSRRDFYHKPELGKNWAKINFMQSDAKKNDS